MVKPDLYEELTPQELAGLDESRRWVLAHCSEPRATETPVGKAWLISEILQRNFVQPDETSKLMALGVLFGDALAQEIPSLSWKAVTDQFGRSPALVYGDTSVTLFPVTMISRRIERGESFDAVELFAATCAEVRQFSQRRDLAPRPRASSQSGKKWILRQLNRLTMRKRTPGKAGEIQ
jgi:hypothetical protein